MSSHHTSRRRVAPAVCILACAAVAHTRGADAATFFWTGGAGPGSTGWGVPTNWNAPPAFTPQNTFSFNGTTNLASTATFQTVGQITFGPNAGPYVIGGLPLSTGGIFKEGTATQTFSSFFSTAGDNTWTVVDGSLVAAGGILANNGNRLDFVPANSTASIVIGGPIAGALGGLSKTGGGTLTLSAANTYTGPTTLNAGTVELGSDSPFSTSTVTLTGPVTLRAVNNARTLTNPLIVQTPSFTLGRLTHFTGTTTLASNAVVTLNNPDGPADSYSTLSNIGESGGPRKLIISAGANEVGNGGLTLAGTGTYSGGTDISTNVRASGTALGTGPVQLSNFALLDVGNGTTVGDLRGSGRITGGTLSTFSNATFDGQIYVSNLIKTGPGTFVIANVCLAGLTTVSGGTLQVGNGISGSLDSNILNNAALVFNIGFNNYWFYQTISGTGTVTKVNSNTFVLSNDVTSTGAFIVSDGVLQVGTGGTSGSISGPIVNNARVDFRRTGSVTYPGTLTGTGSVVVSGGGLVAVTGVFAHTGGTTLSAGTLQVGNGGSSGNLSGSVVNNATLAFDRTGSVVVPVNVSGTGTVVNNGSGTVTLSGTLTHTGGLTTNGPGRLVLTGSDAHTGGTTLSAGTLQIGNGGTTGNLAGDVFNPAGTLTFNRSDNVTYSGSISGDGDVRQAGTGTLTLSGNSFYNGVTYVDAGTLRATSPGAVPRYSSPGRIVVASGATFAVNVGEPGDAEDWRSVDVSDLTSAATFVTGSLLGIDTTTGNFTHTFANVVNAGLTKLGPNTLTLVGSNNYTGSTVIAAGTLQFGDGTGPANLPNLSRLNVVNNGTLAFKVPTNVTIDYPMTGTGGFVQAGTGTVLLAGAFQNTGPTVVSAGTLEMNAFGFINSNSVLTVGNPTGGAPATLLLSGSDRWGNSATTASARITVAPTGTVASAGSYNTLVNLNLAGGTLLLNGGVFADFPAFGLKGTVSVTGSSLSRIVAGTGNNNFINIGPTNAPGAVVFNVADVTASAAPDLIVPVPLQNNVLEGGGTNVNGLTKTGPGTLVLTASNTYTGPTTISAGTLQIGSNGTTGSVAGPIVNNAALIVHRSNDLTVATDISGTGTLTKRGAGVLTLSGTGTSSGSTTVAEGVLRLTGRIGNGGVTVAGGASLELGRPVPLGSSDRTLDGNALTLAGTAGSIAVAKVTTATTTAAGRVKLPLVTVVSSLTVNANASPLGSRTYYGLLDLGTNDLIVRGGNLAALRDLARAYLVSPTQGLGTSSTIPLTRVAVFPNTTSDPGATYYTSFDAVFVTTSEVLVRFTYIGDANLDGRVNGQDLVLLLEGLTTAGTGWNRGDFNYDGVVNGTDLALFNASFAANLPSLGSPSDVDPGVGGVVPEPSSLLAGLAALPLFRRRRRTA